MDCPKCHWPEVKRKCLNCKRNAYYLDQGIFAETPCSRCGVITPLMSNTQCRKCLKEQGLRECRICHEVKVDLLQFQRRSGVCNDCRSPLGHLTPSERMKHQHLKRYGITFDQYASMLEQQQGRCAICREPPEVERDLAVDHDHKTGKVRGLLCTKCNLAIGAARDSREVLEAAIRYLAEAPARPLPDVPAPAVQRYHTHLLEMQVLQLRNENILLRQKLQVGPTMSKASLDVFAAVVRSHIVALSPTSKPTEATRERARVWLDEVLRDIKAQKFI